MLNFFAILLIIFIGILLLVLKKRSFKKLISQSNLNYIKLKKNKKSNNKFLSKKNFVTFGIIIDNVSGFNNNEFTIFSDKATYLKNDEIIFTEGNSKAINLNNIITASDFKFDKFQNILSANKNVKIIDKEKETTIIKSLSYILITLNFVFILIMHILLEFFSTNG